MYYTHNTRRSVARLELPSKSTDIGQKGFSYIGPKLWNELPPNLKFCSSTNDFKHKVKNNLFSTLQRKEDDIYIYY